MEVEHQQWLEDLASDDEGRVISALHAACPCTGSFSTYEEHLTKLKAMAKDPRPAVRAVALHLEVDALGSLRQLDEREAGYERNPSGGFGRRRQPHRPLRGDRRQRG